MNSVSTQVIRVCQWWWKFLNRPMAMQLYNKLIHSVHVFHNLLWMIFFLKFILAIGVFKIRCWRVNYIKIISYGSVPSIFMFIFIRLFDSATPWIRLKGRSQSLMSSFGHRRALEIHSCRSPASNSEFGQLNSKLYSRWIIEGLGSESEKNIHF